MKLNLIKHTLLLAISLTGIIACSDDEKVNEKPGEKPEIIDPNSTVNIPDALFKAYLVGIGQANADTDKDGEIQYSEAIAYKGANGFKIMNINSDVSDVTGIEAFTGIEALRFLSNSKLKSLDLSKNTELQRIIASISSLTELKGLEKLTKLKELTLNKTKLKSLNLSSNPKLEKLHFSCEKGWDSSGSTPKLISTSKLAYLNLANGNTKGFTSVILKLHPNLTCVKVDKGFVKPTSGWGSIDSQISLKNDGGDCK